MVYVTVALLLARVVPTIPISPHRLEEDPIRAGGVYRVTVTPADVGARVSLRRTVPDGVSDVVGVLESWAEGVLVVRRRDGVAVSVAEADLLAGKVVPPR